MTDEQSTVEAPPEATDPRLSSAAKDQFFANAPDGTAPTPPEVVEPVEHQHRSYDVKARNSTVEDADFDAQETNAKGGDEVE